MVSTLTGPTDDNQKRRRHRGGKARRVWRRWSSENPVLATLLTVFIGLCLVGMLMESLSSSSPSSYGVRRHSLKQRMRRAKALFHQAIQQQSESGEDDDEEESESGDDARNRHGRRPHDATNPRTRDHHVDGYRNRFTGDRGDDQQEEEQRPHRGKRFTTKTADEMLEQLDSDIRNNKNGGIRWIAPHLMLPPLATPGRQLMDQNDDQEMTRGRNKHEAVNPKKVNIKSPYFKVHRQYESSAMKWEEEYAALKNDEDMKPPVDYATHAYDYPPLRSDLPDLHDHGTDYPDYPPLQPLGDLMRAWPQDDDFPHAHKRPIPEGLLHFNYSNPHELELARKFRDAELPFKLYDIPEVTAATKKWTDEYVAEQFDGRGFFRKGKNKGRRGGLMDSLLGKDTPKDKDNDDYAKWGGPPPHAEGSCQESPNNYFAFFQPNLWDVKTMGLPPVRNNDWTFEHWSQHARYADAVALNASQPHFYWQSGVPREERHQSKSKWCFISRDLPSLSSPTETFFVFEPQSQKGIQCRFGERGVVAATHYDSGRNMIAMVTGAKRYILAPPKECPSLGIVPWKFNAVFRHSLLNFGHINYMNETSSELDDGEQGNSRRHRTWKGDHMSQVEKEWMEIAANSMAIETVLKAGEVLYIPSHWFHYIVSLQKSAQCNVRSGVHDEGTPAFGGKVDVKTCGRLSVQEAMSNGRN